MENTEIMLLLFTESLTKCIAMEKSTHEQHDSTPAENNAAQADAAGDEVDLDDADLAEELEKAIQEDDGIAV